MTDFSTAADLAALGLSANEVSRLLRTTDLRRIRRGVYSNDPEPSDQIAGYRELCLAVARVNPASVLSHVSAAVLHGLPTFNHQYATVHLTRLDGSAHGRRRPGLHIHRGALDAVDVGQVADARVTGPARTAVDLARTVSYERSVMVGDAALHAGVRPADLERLLLDARGLKGIGAARRSVAFWDGRSDTPGESLSRIRLTAIGLAPPVLQLEVWIEEVLIARGDFGWPEEGVIGEFDGKIKYGRAMLKKGQTSGDAVFAEKRREDRLRDLGWEVVRWTWADLSRPEEIRSRFDRAFLRARQRRRVA